LTLQVPGSVTQSALTLHAVAVLMLQKPLVGQSAAWVHAPDVRLHVPLIAGHCALLVQTVAVCTLQLPWLTQVGGGHVVCRPQTFSGDGGSRLQPGGFQAVVHELGGGGVHTCCMLTQLCVR
jgi:hypothetical protein